MTESDLEALCERADINEDEANDALRTVRLLSAAPPHGIMLSKAEEGVPGGFYKFVEGVAGLMKQTKLKQRSRVPSNPMRA